MWPADCMQQQTGMLRAAALENYLAIWQGISYIQTPPPPPATHHPHSRLRVEDGHLESVSSEWQLHTAAVICQGLLGECAPQPVHVAAEGGRSCAYGLGCFPIAGAQLLGTRLGGGGDVRGRGWRGGGGGGRRVYMCVWWFGRGHHKPVLDAALLHCTASWPVLPPRQYTIPSQTGLHAVLLLYLWLVLCIPYTISYEHGTAS
jgi:hypothetical protein